MFPCISTIYRVGSRSFGRELSTINLHSKILDWKRVNKSHVTIALVIPAKFWYPTPFIFTFVILGKILIAALYPIFQVRNFFYLPSSFVVRLEKGNSIFIRNFSRLNRVNFFPHILFFSQTTWSKHVSWKSSPVNNNNNNNKKIGSILANQARTTYGYSTLHILSIPTKHTNRW